MSSPNQCYGTCDRCDRIREQFKLTRSRLIRPISARHIAHLIWNLRRPLLGRLTAHSDEGLYMLAAGIGNGKRAWLRASTCSDFSCDVDLRGVILVPLHSDMVTTEGC